MIFHCDRDKLRESVDYRSVCLEKESCALQKALTRQLLNSVGDIYDSPLTCSRSSPSIWNLPDDNVIDTLQAELHVAELQLQAETIRQETAQAHRLEG